MSDTCWETRELDKWIDENKNNPVVQQFLIQHPPPNGWTGTNLEWAFANSARSKELV
jgi:hypothetical protein